MGCYTNLARSASRRSCRPTHCRGAANGTLPTCLADKWTVSPSRCRQLLELRRQTDPVGPPVAVPSLLLLAVWRPSTLGFWPRCGEGTRTSCLAAGSKEASVLDSRADKRLSCSGNVESPHMVVTSSPVLAAGSRDGPCYQLAEDLGSLPRLPVTSLQVPRDELNLAHKLRRCKRVATSPARLNRAVLRTRVEVSRIPRQSRNDRMAFLRYRCFNRSSHRLL